MADISTLIIPASSKTGKVPLDYKNYLVSYKSFTMAKRKFVKRSCAEVDSQFSERLAADIFNFDVDHSSNLDGKGLISGDTYEVKATGFSNNKAHFNAKIKRTMLYG